MKQKGNMIYNNYKQIKTKQMENSKVTHNTTKFSHAGRACARTMWMFKEETPEHQDAIKEYLKYEAQVLNPKNEMEFECAKAFIMAGGTFIKEVGTIHK